MAGSCAGNLPAARGRNARRREGACIWRQHRGDGGSIQTCACSSIRRMQWRGAGSRRCAEGHLEFVPQVPGGSTRSVVREVDATVTMEGEERGGAAAAADLPDELVGRRAGDVDRGP
jgi:hypothetical protein